ncbi:hypothetical protein ACFLZK_00035 [Patescibacteria group bacterium]
MLLLLYLPMISRTLIRLIDQAIVPAILLLCTRLASVIVVSYILGAKFIFSAKGFIFHDPDNYIAVNSFSTLSMVVVLGLGLTYILVKALYFHDTHVSPKLTTKLFHHKLVTLIQSSFELYSQGVIWLTYLYLVTIVTVILGMFGVIYNWITIVSGSFCVITTLLLILDIEHELDEIDAGYVEEIAPINNNLEKEDNGS